MSAVELTWLAVHHRELTAKQMHDLLMLRHDVFVIEQDCPGYRDIDGCDASGDTHHVVGLDDDRLLAAARLLAPGSDHEARIGRVVVDQAARGTGVGHELMRQSLAACTRLWPSADVVLGAQAHLAGYYGRHGFVSTGDAYVEDEIPHVTMVLHRKGKS